MYVIHDGDENRYPFNFSVVMAVYKVEPYLAEAIDSIIHQSIGFRDNIQLILVNDGSPDGCGAICEEYAARWPENIVYIRKDNGGVSSARNTGLLYVEGQYVNFLDADDKWSEDAFEEAASFFQRHPAARIAAAKHYFFDAKEGKHPLGYKYNAEAMIDLHETFDYPQMFVNNVWIHKDLLEGKEFDTRLSVCEDCALINRILLEEMQCGIVSRPTYWYRRRKDDSSAFNQSRNVRTWYMDTPEYCYRMLFRLSEEMYGEVLPFIQYTVMYDLQWRAKSKIPHPLTEDDFSRYLAVCRELLEEIEDEIILAQRNTDRSQKLDLLAMKRGVTSQILRRHLRIMYNDVYLDGTSALHESAGDSYVGEDNPCKGRETITPAPGTKLLRLWDLKSETRIELLALESRADGIYVEGRLFTLYPMQQVDVKFRAGQELSRAEVFERGDLARELFYEKSALVPFGFRGIVPPCTFTVQLFLGGRKVDPHIEKYGPCSPLTGRRHDYAILDKPSNRKQRQGNSGAQANRSGQQENYRPGQWMVTQKGASFRVKHCGWLRGRMRILRKEFLYEWNVYHEGSDSEKEALSQRRRTVIRRLIPLHHSAEYAGTTGDVKC